MEEKRSLKEGDYLPKRGNPLQETVCYKLGGTVYEEYILPAVDRNHSMTKWCGSFARKPLPHLLTKGKNRSIIKTATCLSGVHYRRNEP